MPQRGGRRRSVRGCLWRGDPATTIARELTVIGLAAPGFNVGSAQIDIDDEAMSVTLSHPNQPPRTAVFAESQGCVILPKSADTLSFEPQLIDWQGPAADEPWPLGEIVVPGDSPMDRDALGSALDRHIRRAGMRAVVVLHRGELVGERYAEGYGPMVPQRGWSTGKSVAATAIGRMVDRGDLELDQPVPVAAWLSDERNWITLRHMVNMSSGLNDTFHS